MEEGFTSKLLCENTWMIRGGDAAAYLLVGDACGIVIDTGDSPHDLRAYAESLAGKPVRMAANTHGHPDHCGGNCWFESAYMSEGARQVAREIAERRHLEVSQYFAKESLPVGDGTIIDLGNRQIEAFEIGMHSLGDIAYLDKKEHILFTGDCIGENVTLVYWCEEPQPSMIKHVMALAKLLQRRSEIRYVCWGHAVEMLDATALDNSMIAALKVLGGNLGEKITQQTIHINPDGSPGFFMKNLETKRCIEQGNIAINYDERYIFDTKEYPNLQGT